MFLNQLFYLKKSRMKSKNLLFCFSTFLGEDVAKTKAFRVFFIVKKKKKTF